MIIKYKVTCPNCGNEITSTNNELAENFVDSDFNMDLIPKYEIPEWFKGDIKAWERNLVKE